MKPKTHWNPLWPLLVVAFVWIVSVPARAAVPLSLDEVLESVDRTHPGLERAQRGVERAEAKKLSARGGFDPTLSVRSRWSPIGYYENGQVDTMVRQATPAWGAALYAGYRIGWGNYPAYYGYRETLGAGEVRAGLDVPVWRDGPIDARRAEIRKTKYRHTGARQARDAAQLELERDAADAYWRWVAAGQSLEVARDLLAIAERRDAALNEQAKEGAIERIQLVDNRRLVLDRMAKVVTAERKFQEAALKLSLFYRDRDLRPIVAGEERIPQTFPEPARIDSTELAADVQRAVDRRPDLEALRAERNAADVDVRLAKNQRAPAINLQTFVAKDFGGGPPQLEPTEWGIGVTFELPIPLRKARGDFRAAKADLAGVDAQLRGLADKVAAEVQAAHVAVEASRQNVLLARQQVSTAKQLADAERTKYAEGASDLVIVNLREIAAAEALTQEIDALADYHSARAQYVTATGRSVTR
jgi:outer membrane protein TolC